MTSYSFKLTPRDTTCATCGRKLKKRVDLIWHAKGKKPHCDRHFPPTPRNSKQS